ncbi:hypothetical protein ACFCXS_28320 [Streptomyces sp. NPDC056373]
MSRAADAPRGRLTRGTAAPPPRAWRGARPARRRPGREAAA